jgi:twitching motility protein PilT
METLARAITRPDQLDRVNTEGSVDFGFSFRDNNRFRVNVFRERGNLAIAVRMLPLKLLDLETIGAPPAVRDLLYLPRGLVLVTGPTGSGKTTSLASMLTRINETSPRHIITIEDPIEFLHPHKRATIHQRELHTDTPSFGLALRAALRQAPKLILVGEMRDRETIEVALEAAETGHLVYSTLHTIDASKTIERIVGVFPLSDQQAIRMRLAKSFRFIISQRLIRKPGGTGRVAAFEILKSTLRTREYIQKGEGEGKSLLDAMRDGENEGMQYFDGEIEKLIRTGVIDMDTGLAASTNPGNLRLLLADLLEPQSQIPSFEIESAAAKGPDVAVTREPDLEPHY